MNRSEIKDFNKFKQFFKEKHGSLALSLYCQGLNQQVPEDMEDVVRQINEEYDKEERRKAFQTLKQEFEPEKTINPKKKLKVGDLVKAYDIPCTITDIAYSLDIPNRYYIVKFFNNETEVFQRKN